MKRFHIICLFVALFSSFGQSRGLGVARNRGGRRAARSRRSVTINRLHRIEVAPGKYASQLSFEFSRPVYCETKESIRGEQIKIYFPGINLGDFKLARVVREIKKLPEVKQVSVKHEKDPVSRVVLTMNFEKGLVILKMTKTEEPNLLTLDIFDRKTLERLKNKGTTILKASNRLQNRPSGIIPLGQGKLLCCLDTCSTDGIIPTVVSQSGSKKKSIYNPKKLNIVIDAGHGGKDPGASAFGLKEKNLTLDIARRVHAKLKKEGYRVFLTRSTDTYLSVVDRFQLAQQLKADLFVSVHVNAAGIGRVSGVETHFLDGSPESRFLFINSDEDRRLACVAKKLFQGKVVASKLLSTSIQNSILSCLKKKKVPVVDRGVKATSFRTLLRSEVPSAIVEVGFVTNKKEAKRLGQGAYRDTLACGIISGVKKCLGGQRCA